MADKPVMKQIDLESWEPRVMVAPDGREWTPGSYVEERELSSLGYRFADPVAADDAPEPTVAQTRVRTTAKKSSGDSDGPAPATNVEPAQ